MEHPTVPVDGAKIADLSLPTEREFTALVESESDEFNHPVDGPAYDPFHNTPGRAGHTNVIDGYNSASYPDTTVSGLEVVSEYKAAQHFHDEHPVEAAAHIVDSMLREFDLHPVGARFVLNKISGAYGWKVGVMESAARAVLCEHYDLVPAPRDIPQVAQDEGNNIDLVLVKPDGSPFTVQVKTNCKPDTDNVDACALIDTENETLTIHK